MEARGNWKAESGFASSEEKAGGPSGSAWLFAA
jgi:hypothetical protein